MNSIKVICPFEPTLIKRLKSVEIAVRVNSPDLIPAASETVAESGNRLMAVILDSEKTLGEIQLNEDWGTIPIALMTPSMGRFSGIAESARILRGLNLRVFLPYGAENMTGVRILASIGIPCCIVPEVTEPDWDAFADLMTYAVLERVPHAAIEPFDFIKRHYKENSYIEWGRSYFEDSAHFLHLDSEGRAAFSRKALLDGNFIGDVSDLAAALNKATEWKTLNRRKLFLENHPCSRCLSFKMCLGRAWRGEANQSGCSAFFSEAMEVLELYHAQTSTVQERTVWQL